MCAFTSDGSTSPAPKWSQMSTVTTCARVAQARNLTVSTANHCVPDWWTHSTVAKDGRKRWSACPLVRRSLTACASTTIVSRANHSFRSWIWIVGLPGKDKSYINLFPLPFQSLLLFVIQTALLESRRCLFTYITLFNLTTHIFSTGLFLRVRLVRSCHEVRSYLLVVLLTAGGYMGHPNPCTGHNQAIYTMVSFHYMCCVFRNKKETLFFLTTSKKLDYQNVGEIPLTFYLYFAAGTSLDASVFKACIRIRSSSLLYFTLLCPQKYTV